MSFDPRHITGSPPIENVFEFGGITKAAIHRIPDLVFEKQVILERTLLPTIIFTIGKEVLPENGHKY